MRRTPGARSLAVSVCVVLGVGACTGGPADEPVPTASGEPSTTPSAVPPPARPTSTPGGRGLQLTFESVEAVGAGAALAVRKGRVPAVLRSLDDPSSPGTSTALTCASRDQRTLDVPVPLDGLLRLRASTRVAADLSGDRFFAVLALTSDRAVLLGLDPQGRVRSRASAQQIDERWFVREVEDCRRGSGGRLGGST